MHLYRCCCVKEDEIMVENLINATTLEKGLFIMAAGVTGVFVVLILFYLLIKVITRLFPEKDA